MKTKLEQEREHEQLFNTLERKQIQAVNDLEGVYEERLKMEKEALMDA